MKNFLSKIWDKSLYFFTLFLLIFIPLYPKIPIIDVRNTWVYVRAEDFLVIVVLILWSILLIKKKITLKTPLTIPIFVFWIIGLISTLHGIIFIFPTLANVFSNVAFLSYLRHLEYLSLFFVSFASIKDKRSILGIIYVFIAAYICVNLYGIGQKLLGFPAYLTMNEEFAKGAPITLSSLSRVPSTFAGHYDLAAYLVFSIPIIASLIFGVRNWYIRIFLSGLVLLGLGVLVMTVSRVSFPVLILSLLLVVFIQNKKIFLLSIPILVLGALMMLKSESALFSRFGNTVKEIDVLVDAKSGAPIGHVEYVSSEKYKNQFIEQRRIGADGQLYTQPITEEDRKKASPSSVLDTRKLPDLVPEVTDVNLSTGENLPQGTGYINLVLSPVTRSLGYFMYQKKDDEMPNAPPQNFIFQGNFLLKRASAYDLSFTTRFQGEWPNTLAAFEKNIFLGSGYGSVSLAVDNNYLRILGEIGILGMASFISIFAVIGILIKKTISKIDSPVTKSFVIGFAAGLVGLSLNAVLIDVFEASKIAFVLWLLSGAIVGTLLLYQREAVNVFLQLKKLATSEIAYVLYLGIFAAFIFLPMVNNFFVADDFTWIRWASDCSEALHGKCLSFSTIKDYFLNSDGFFYRPGTKIYFLLMYSVFWLNQVVYHSVSIILHFMVSILFFLLAKKILKNQMLAFLGSAIFLIMSGYAESIFWISSTGYLFTAFFVLLSILFYDFWLEKRKIFLFALSLSSIFLSLLFHELGIVTPLTLIAYRLFKENSLSIKKIINFENASLFIPVAFYLILRFISQSHWFSGDYSYNLIKLPLNFIGNLFGYLMITLMGSAPFYDSIRNLMKENILPAALLLSIFIGTMIYFSKSVFRKLERKDLNIILFGFSFFIICLLPFLGLGNITSRYSYLASIGIILVLMYFLKRLYDFLLSYGKEIAVLASILAIGVFSFWHIVALQQIYFDWNGAGEKTKNFFISINGLYSNLWSNAPVELHLVNVPIRYGEAWVFPVGLDDAVWLAFKNDDLKIYTHRTTEEAFLQGSGATGLNPVFVFQEDGTLKETYRPPQP